MEPHHFGGTQLSKNMPRDPNRDTTNLTLLKKALELKIPMLGIFREFQEMNVALGGKLTQQVNSLHEQEVDNLAKTLKIEGTASDGLIEAFSLADNTSYYLGSTVAT